MLLIYDVETANGSNVGSICAVGWIMVDRQEIVDRGYTLINPHCKFEKHNIAVHGITEDMVQSAPSFAQYWRECLGEKMNHAIVLAHSAGFDMAATEQALFDASIEDLGIDYVDTLEIAREYLDSPSYKLFDLAAEAGYADYQRHQAGADAEALLRVLDYIRRENNYTDIETMVIDSFARVRNTKENNYVPKVTAQALITRKNRCKESVKAFDQLLTGIKFCLTGDVKGYSRSEIEKKIMEHGGKVTSMVSIKTNCLVVGSYADYGDDYVSGKQKKAQELIAEGAKIQIFSYEVLLDILAGKKKLVVDLPKPPASFVDEAKARKAAGKPRGNPVQQLKVDGTVIRHYETVDDAVIETGIHPKCIHDAAIGKQKKAGGYCWKYIST